MNGVIQQAKMSKSGQTVRLQINNVWYSSKSPELLQATGQAITFESSVQDFPDGGSCTWLNDHTIDNNPAQPTPSDQAMNQAMAPPLGSPTPPSQGLAPTANLQRQAPTQVNKDALIGALALTKSITGQPEQVWEAFVYFYHKMDNFDPSVPY